jgi:hypothetical protein
MSTEKRFKFFRSSKFSFQKANQQKNIKTPLRQTLNPALTVHPSHRQTETAQPSFNGRSQDAISLAVTTAHL